MSAAPSSPAAWIAGDVRRRLDRDVAELHLDGELLYLVELGAIEAPRFATMPRAATRGSADALGDRNRSHRAETVARRGLENRGLALR